MREGERDRHSMMGGGYTELGLFLALCSANTIFVLRALAIAFSSGMAVVHARSFYEDLWHASRKLVGY